MTLIVLVDLLGEAYCVRQEYSRLFFETRKLVTVTILAYEYPSAVIIIQTQCYNTMGFSFLPSRIRIGALLILISAIEGDVTFPFSSCPSR